jgi:hypothetical protein
VNGLDAVATLIVIGAMVVGRVVTTARARADRLLLEQNVAGGLARPDPRPAPATAPSPGRRSTTPSAARLPQRVPPEATHAPAPSRPAPIPVTGRRAGGPRWAANAFIAAEVFGPPVADRSGGPGGTLGPPNAF